MAADRRVRAAANLDGTFHLAVRRDRPFLLVGSEAGHVPGKDGTSDESRPGMSGWKRWLTVARTEGTCFTDPACCRTPAACPEALAGDHPHVRGSPLRPAPEGRKRPLLDGPSADAREMAFHAP